MGDAADEYLASEEANDAREQLADALGRDDEQEAHPMTTLDDLEKRLEEAEELRWALLFSVAKTILPDNQFETVLPALKKFAKAGAWTDAALALVEERLPGWRWSLNSANVFCLCKDWNDDYAPVFWSKKPRKRKPGERPIEPAKRAESCPTPALAILLALVRAEKET